MAKRGNPFRIGDRVFNKAMPQASDGTVVEIVSDESVRVYWRKPHGLIPRQDTVMYLDELVRES